MYHVAMAKLKCSGPNCNRDRIGLKLYCKSHVQQLTRGLELSEIQDHCPGPCNYPGCYEPRARRQLLCAEHRRVSWALKKKYGISILEKVAMAAAQANKCRICDNQSEAPDGGSLVVDHCHTTGAVRGLLCNSCNWMLGLARDNPGILSRAIAYLGEPDC